MSGDFFELLNTTEPNINLESDGGTQAEQTANIMVRFEQELLANPADLVLVIGVPEKWDGYTASRIVDILIGLAQ
jgi:UDP-N-acetylglucosamine 2-epimerase (non-hydrolysing)